MRMTRLPATPLRRLGAYAAATLLLLLNVGCPHRSPLWSPDGKSILVLTDRGGEEVKKAASELWIVQVGDSKAQRLEAPEKDLRFLGAAWLDNERFVAVTGRWDSGYVESESEKLWLVEEGGKKWTAVAGPRPSESRITMHPPVVCLPEGGRPLVVYPAEDEAVVVVDPSTGKLSARAEPAELIGEAPSGGFLVQRPEEGDTGDTELAALDARGNLLWKRSFANLRREIAGILEKKAVEIVFNDTSTSRLVEGGARVGLTLVFSDVSWKEGLAGYYIELTKDAKLAAVVPGRGVWGRPAAHGGRLLAVAAPQSDAELPLRIVEIELATRKTRRSTVLEGLTNKAIYGYALGPSGKRFALSVGGHQPALRIYDAAELSSPNVIPLR